MLPELIDQLINLVSSEEIEQQEVSFQENNRKIYPYIYVDLFENRYRVMQEVRRKAFDRDRCGSQGAFCFPGCKDEIWRLSVARGTDVCAQIPLLGVF